MMSRHIVQRFVLLRIAYLAVSLAFGVGLTFAQQSQLQRPQQRAPQSQQKSLYPQPAAPVTQPARQPVQRQVALPSQATQDPFKLTPDERKRLETLLGFWESKSDSVKTYSCKFVRWEYDSVFGPRNPKFAKQKSEGVIRYAAPDKGEFKVEAIGDYDSAKDPKQNGMIATKASNHDEHWICDGNSIFELDGKTKQLRQEKLPPEMQGQRIADGPLPFMFGARKEKLLARYWMREIVPPNGRKGEYWFEAQPKFREDAANYQRIRLVLDEKEYLPLFMEVFPPTYDGRKNWSRTTYAFKDRKVNDPLQRGQQFLGRFISPSVPRGWKKVVSNFGQPTQSPVMNAKTPRQTNQAKLPAREQR